MSTHTIERDIEIEAPVGVVWRTVTEPEQIAAWLGDAVELEPQAGATGTITFRRDTDDPLVVDITVVAAEPPHRFSFRWCYPAGDVATETNSTLVTFTLVADGEERTRLRVVESGLDQMEMADEEKERFADQHSHGWQVQGDRLRDLFASGRTSSP